MLPKYHPKPLPFLDTVARACIGHADVIPRTGTLEILRKAKYWYWGRRLDAWKDLPSYELSCVAHHKVNKRQQKTRETAA